MEKEIYLFFISQTEKEIEFFPNKPQKNQTILIIKKISNGKGIYRKEKYFNKFKKKKQLSFKKYK